MTETVPTVVYDRDEHYFGACSECGKTDGYRNAGREHWFFCDEHEIRWCAGSNLFSSWREESEEEQYAAWLPISTYEDVTPHRLSADEETALAAQAAEEFARFVADEVDRANAELSCDRCRRPFDGKTWNMPRGDDFGLVCPGCLTRAERDTALSDEPF